MRGVFAQQGVKGVVIACPDCGANHYYEWELLKENLEHMLQTGEPRMHEPAFEVREDEYIQWDYGKGYIDALADTGLEPDRRVEVTRAPGAETPAEDFFSSVPSAAVRSPPFASIVSSSTEAWRSGRSGRSWSAPASNRSNAVSVAGARGCSPRGACRLGDP